MGNTRGQNGLFRSQTRLELFVFGLQQRDFTIESREIVADATQLAFPREHRRFAADRPELQCTAFIEQFALAHDEAGTTSRFRCETDRRGQRVDNPGIREQEFGESVNAMLRCDERVCTTDDAWLSDEVEWRSLGHTQVNQPVVLQIGRPGLRQATIGDRNQPDAAGQYGVPFREVIEQRLILASTSIAARGPSATSNNPACSRSTSSSSATLPMMEFHGDVGVVRARCRSSFTPSPRPS